MTQDERAIRDVVDTWFAASKAGDIATVLDLMTDDVIFMVAGQPPLGKKAFAAASEGMKNVKIEGAYDIQEIQVLGDWAYLRNHIRMTITPPGGSPAVRPLRLYVDDPAQGRRRALAACAGCEPAGGGNCSDAVMMASPGELQGQDSRCAVHQASHAAIAHGVPALYRQ